LKLTLIIQISIGAILINNFILTRMLGLCPFLCVTKKISGAVKIGISVTLVMGAASVIAWLVDNIILIPYDITFLRIVVFILLIASLVQFTGMMIQKLSPELNDAMRSYLPLITTNCAILAVALLTIQDNPYTGISFTLAEALLNGIMSGVGFMIVLIIMAGIREKIESGTVLKSLEGLPIALISAGLISLAFSGFAGLHFPSTPGGY